MSDHPPANPPWDELPEWQQDLANRIADHLNRVGCTCKPSPAVSFVDGGGVHISHFEGCPGLERVRKVAAAHGN